MDTKVKKLTPKQELFCQYYTGEFFGNGTQSYIKAYSTPKKSITFKVAQVEASKSIRKPKILERINELLKNLHVDENTVDAQIAFWITQKHDSSASLQAIREWNKLQGRITNKLDHTSKGKRIKTINIINYADPKPDSE